ncbi:MAG: c-type cytochrome [Gammaproteobacteria bacterium]|nr:c-type cytochrome [Gammaproteobacteria bacterium]
MRPRARLSLKALGCIAAALVAAGAALEPAPPPIAPGDPRSGYEDESFRTASRQIATHPGDAAGLATLAQNPPLGLAPLPPGRQPVPAAIDLGRRLFFDRRLSGNATLSCAMCHIPEQGFTQHELKTPVGIEGRFVHRNAPSLYNIAYLPELFHDGREQSLEQQIWAPLLADNEMGNASRAAVLERLRRLDDYAEAFQVAFAGEINEATLGQALASYQRALLSADSPFDRWYLDGDAEAVSPAGKRGFGLFVRNGCANCHQLDVGHAPLTDDGYHDTGVGYRAERDHDKPLDRMQIAPGVIINIDTSIAVPFIEDSGRMAVTHKPEDRWRYRTPSLRNVAITGPYMHDGSIATLEAVVDYYAAGGVPHPGQDELIRPLDLDASDKRDLLEFLRSLTGSNVAELAADARSAPIGDSHDAP